MTPSRAATSAPLTSLQLLPIAVTLSDICDMYQLKHSLPICLDLIAVRFHYLYCQHAEEPSSSRAPLCLLRFVQDINR